MNEKKSRIDTNVREREWREKRWMRVRDREELLMNELKISIDIFYFPLVWFFVSAVFISLFTDSVLTFQFVIFVCLFRIFFLLVCSSTSFLFGFDNMTQLIYFLYVLLFFSRNFKPLKMARITEQQQNYLNKIRDCRLFCSFQCWICLPEMRPKCDYCFCLVEPSMMMMMMTTESRWHFEMAFFFNSLETECCNNKPATDFSSQIIQPFQCSIIVRPFSFVDLILSLSVFWFYWILWTIRLKIIHFSSRPEWIDLCGTFSFYTYLK